MITVEQGRDTNEYLHRNLLSIDVDSVSKKELISKIRKVHRLYKNKEDLDKLYELTRDDSLRGDDEWRTVIYRLKDVYSFLTDDWVCEVDKLGESPSNEVSKIMEALVYQVLIKYNKCKTIQYEPELFIQNRKITPDFLINDKRIVEVKLSSGGSFRNKKRYMMYDDRMVKVYLSEEEDEESQVMHGGGDCSILSLIGFVENEMGIELGDEREMVNRLIGMNEGLRSDDMRELESKKRIDTALKIEVLRAQIKSILRIITKDRGY